MRTAPGRSPGHRLCRAIVADAALALALFASRPASAAPCNRLPNPVYVAGSTAAKPLLAEIAKVMLGADPPVTVVYAGLGSCAGVDAILNGTPLVGSGPTGLISWSATGIEQTCDVVSGSVVNADIGVSDVFASTCFDLPGGLPSNVADFLGPIQTMTFVVPKASTEKAISAEAAYNVFGFGADSGVAPWTDETAILRRDAQSGTQQMIAAAISVGAARWRGTAATSSGDLVTRLVAATGPSQALGILAADVAQDNRSTLLNVLAYQHFGQSCGYLPDRDATSNEKANVRDGHYAIWGPLHLLTHVGTSGLPVKAGAASVAGFMAGTKPTPPNLDMVFLEAQRHVVPQCAMRVHRTEEMGPLTAIAPANPCGCYYEKVANGGTTCTPCAGAQDCSPRAAICSYGYCEGQ